MCPTFNLFDISLLFFPDFSILETFCQTSLQNSYTISNIIWLPSEKYVLIYNIIIYFRIYSTTLSYASRRTYLILEYWILLRSQPHDARRA